MIKSMKQMKNSKINLCHWLPVIVWCGLIFLGSSIPSPQPTKDWLIDFILHKLFHLFEYGVLFLLVYRAKRNLLLTFIFIILYAISDELHQSFVPTREAALRDVFIDFIGGLLGWQFLSLIQARKQKN